MSEYVLDLEEIGREQVDVVGGKAASLGELSRIEGLRVPPGFCVTTAAYRRVISERPRATQLIERLSHAGPSAGDRQSIHALAAELRRTIESAAVPEEIAAETTAALARLGDRVPCAVRSSATTEDLPTASFAGQQESYLDVTGSEAILDYVRRCWASLFTERAVAYRLQQGIGHRSVEMAVIVQRMVVPQAAGVLFTADPVTGHRKVSAIEAAPGRGDALVAGRVSGDRWTIRDGAIGERALRGERPLLTDEQLLHLAQLGGRIAARAGAPQDIEWCLAHDEFHVVQARPITTLFPIPARDDAENHVYISVGHQQMMTDAMKPLGLSMWQLTAAAPMHAAGSRLFVDATRALGAPSTRAGLLALIGRSDPLIGGALESLIDRGDFIPTLPDPAPAAPAAGKATPAAAPAPIPTDPAIVAELVVRNQASIESLKREIVKHSGEALMDFIHADLQELKRLLFDPRSHQATMAGMEATWWLNDHLQEWLGDKNAADALAQSAPGNVTSEMGLALLRVADAIRPHPAVVDYLGSTRHDDFLEALPSIPGGREARNAIVAWLGKYGMRGPGEIDITRPRWSDQPAALLPLILGNVRDFEAGEGARRFETGLRESARRERELLARVRALPGGAAKAAEVKRMIGRLRTFIGYREYPKYGMIARYLEYRRALLREADRLVEARVIPEREDIFWLTFPELRDAVATRQVHAQLIRERKATFGAHQALTPPRVLTSDGEAVTGRYRRDGLPDGALAGLAVSAGTVEGRARVALDMATARLEPGDILVTRFTDPSWTPLFVAASALVTEVGGLMTHGAVIAREYGLPAVVGVEEATRLIRDGQRIRVHGTEGYVEILD